MADEQSDPVVKGDIQTLNLRIDSLVKVIEGLERELDSLKEFVYDPWENGQNLADAIEDIQYELANPVEIEEESTEGDIEEEI